MYTHKVIIYGRRYRAKLGISTFQEQASVRNELSRSFTPNHCEEYIGTIRKMLKAYKKDRNFSTDYKGPILYGNFSSQMQRCN